jgi:hypothetical protein
MDKESDEKGSGSKENEDEVKPSSGPSRPRRERKEIPAEEKVQAFAVEETMPNEGEITKPRRRREKEDEPDKGENNGGWMSMNQADKKYPAINASVEEFEMVPQALNKDKHFQENNDDIMIIPDLEEDGADADQRIAHAPRNINRKIPTLIDLENEVKTAVTSIDSGFDLTILLSTLVPAALVLETDTTWTFESLLRDVTDELTAPSKTVTDTSIKAPVATGSYEKSRIPKK